MMHPAMALWIFSVSMGRVWQDSLWRTMGVSDCDRQHTNQNTNESSAPARLILANGYLKSDVAETPLPGKLLDRLAELYWTERDSELAI